MNCALENKCNFHKGNTQVVILKVQKVVSLFYKNVERHIVWTHGALNDNPIGAENSLKTLNRVRVITESESPGAPSGSCLQDGSKEKLDEES